MPASASKLIVQKLISALARRFGSRDARFRLAVACGFLISAVGVLVLGAGLRLGVADSIWGAMGLPDSGGAAPRQQAYEPSPQYAPRRHAAPHVQTASASDDDTASPTRVAKGRSMCVRLCDGFAFPVGDYHGEGDRAAHEATCQSQCPGARTALFLLPSGADTIGEAVQVGTGRAYSEMPDAFHYTTYIDASCSCHPHGGNRIKSLLHDFTLRRGDAIMTAKGMRVFHGGESFPFKRKDFVALNQSRDVRKGDRDTLKRIERASLGRPGATDIAQAPAAKPSPVAAKAKLEHQARN